MSDAYLAARDPRPPPSEGVFVHGLGHVNDPAQVLDAFAGFWGHMWQAAGNTRLEDIAPATMVDPLPLPPLDMDLFKD
eukprot:568280-Amphidinium_carterae.3